MPCRKINRFGKRTKKTFSKNGKIPGGLLHGPAYESADVSDASYPDGWSTLQAIATMKKMNAEGKPFFMATGFKKPHLDFIAPKKYWDLYKKKISNWLTMRRNLMEVPLQVFTALSNFVPVMASRKRDQLALNFQKHFFMLTMPVRHTLMPRLDYYSIT